MDQSERYQSSGDFNRSDSEKLPHSYDTTQMNGTYYYSLGGEDLGQNPNQIGNQGFSAPNSPTPPRPDSKRQGRGSRGILAFALSLLSVAVIFSVLTIVAMTQFYRGASHSASEKKAEMRALSTEVEAAAPKAKNTNLNKEGAVSKTASGTEKLLNRHFSIEQAAARSVDGKKTLTIAEIAAAGRPTVVAISTEKATPTMYGNVLMPVAGSGFFISEDGYIATNNHVVESSQSIKVALTDGSVLEARLVAADALTDLAVIKVEASEGQKFPAAKLGDSSDILVGELAVAIGNPSGTLEGSVTAGIISALERNITIGGVDMTFIQTDAAINSGNSGGALFNSFGEVIGINSAKLSSNGSSSYEGLGFAIPINSAKLTLESLIQNGFVKGRVQLGISGEQISKQVAIQNKLAPVAGVYIREVVSNGSADLAGLKAGDLLYEFHGKEVSSVMDLNNAKRLLKPGDKVEFKYYRGGKSLSGSMEMQEFNP